ncbi:thiamine pyrophosphate-dependent enzyme [Bogoriella caseilytica]|uniref:2-oxoisovalerate dehydrogenase subunit alpha n=1 Tax=Bogoriella caseilytica TaxID=56055 RepID=A0A3N2BBT6_9MICO|nr:thiamine pyrophosphate-dependent enzyme [Bogoriella caseilytica]ROR72710.1 pyruvate dehydrogenase E1 component alpha subunit [Bogoriella caseilytica]
METIQLLDPAGRRCAEGPAATAAELAGLRLDTTAIDDDLMRAMYRDMVLTRAFDNQATALQRQGELGLWAQSLGQEGAQIGAAHALEEDDYLFPSYREHGMAQVRGLDLREILPLFRGTQHGGWDPAAHNFHIYSLVIGTQTLHAVGYAMGLQRDAKRAAAAQRADGDGAHTQATGSRAVMVCFGDGATSQGDVNEALVFAASSQAPVVFFLQNNHWAISVPSSTQSPVPLASRGAGFGVPAVRVDGNDPLASYVVTRAALERARRGDGPVLIEAVTYRMGAHTTSDDPTRYREAAEEQAWAERDPIARLRAYLEAEQLADADFLTGVDAEADEFAAATREHCRALAAADVEGGIFDHVYGLPHAQVRADRDAHRDFEQSFEESR